MGRITLLSLLCLFSRFILAVGSVEFYDVVDIDNRTYRVWSTNNGSAHFPLIVESTSSRGKSANTPIKAYLPIEEIPSVQTPPSTQPISASGNHILVRNSTNLIPRIMETGSGAVNSSGEVVVRLFYENNSGENAYLYAAAQHEDDNYIIVGKRVAPIASDTGKRYSYNFPLRIENLCLSKKIEFCESFYNEQLRDKENIKIYLFLSSESDYDIDADIDINIGANENSGGVYLHLFLSDSVIDTTDSSMDFLKLHRGDGSLIIEYKAKRIDDFYDIVSLVREQTPFPSVARGSPSSSYLGGVTQMIYHINAPEREGRIVLSPLKNDTEYYILPLIRNKYQFTSLPPNARFERPIALEEILTKEQCYILSAGFQEKHFIIDYFRFLRDYILMPFPLGRGLVDLYYRTAPKYASIIYRDPLLGFLVRIGAYLLFFTINIGLVSLIVFVIIRIRRRKYGRSF